MPQQAQTESAHKPPTEPQAPLPTDDPVEQRWKAYVNPDPNRQEPPQDWEKGDAVRHTKTFPDGKTRTTTCLVVDAYFDTKGWQWKYKLKEKATYNEYEDGKYIAGTKLVEG